MEGSRCPSQRTLLCKLQVRFSRLAEVKEAEEYLRLMTNGRRWDILIHTTPMQNWKMVLVPPSVWSRMNAVTVD
ncbi:hypothetical protein JHK86_010900 [Glycine max]|nr:hypothetical protein JHK86_010900 [Glycine max]